MLMYIAPNSIIRILKGVKLDNTYQHTIYFSDKTKQAEYFSSLTKYVVTNYTYQRQERKLRIGILADNLFDCNYIMFQNSAFGNKWFYGFITGVEYVNNEASNITFEIDVMQTWFYDCTLNASFVEREHSVSDHAGDNLIPENLELGEYVSDDFDGTNLLGGKSIVVAATFNKDFEDVSGGMYSGIYSGLCYNVFTSYSDVNEFIDDAVDKNKASGIVSIFMMPSKLVSKVGESVQTFDITKTKKISGAIDNGYVPKNKKMYTYPYNFLYVTNLNGVGVPFPYEYFSDLKNCTFTLAGDMSCNPQVMLFPTNYKGVSANINEKMILDGYPQCSYNIDSFKAWLAQNATQLPLQGIAAVAGLGVASIATGGLAPLFLAGGTAAETAMVVGGITQIGGILASVADHATLPSQARNTNGNSAMTAMGVKDFAFMHMHIRREFAEIIDDYWDMYGYPSHSIKPPNISARPHWNYIKTVDVNIVGSIPSDDLAVIKGCFNRGITFWKNGNEVGNYQLDNRL